MRARADERIRPITLTFGWPHALFRGDFRPFRSKGFRQWPRLNCIVIARIPAARSEKSDVGANVRLSGWVHRVRDHGGVLFIDLRDHYGLTQVVADPDSAAFKAAELVRSEWVDPDRR